MNALKFKNLHFPSIIGFDEKELKFIINNIDKQYKEWDEIKIDKIFIDNIVKNESDKALVEAIILMAHRLKLKVVAEGIENKEQYDYLKSVNCDLYQGYYFSRPLYSHQIDKFFKNLNI